METQQAPQPAPAVVDTPAPETPSTMEDTIRATWKDMREPKPVEEPKETPKVEKQPAEKPVEPKAGPERDEQGRFKAKAPDGTETIVEGEQKPEPKAVEEQPATEDEPKAAESAFPEAPSSWTKDAKEAYAELPENLKAEIHRRENDFHRGIEKFRGMANIGEVLHKEISPYAELIQQNGTNAPAVIRNLLSTQKTLLQGTPEEKANTVASILSEYGIDTELVNAAIQNPRAPRDPAISHLTEQVSALQKQLSEAQVSPYMQAVETFAADPKNEYFPIVQDDMLALLQMGRASDLQDAYNKAIWTNPESRAKLMAKQQEDERRRAAEKAAAAKQASSTNVNRRGTPPAAPANGTMEDTIRATYKKLAG